ncbi:MAG: hypothetical protein WC935_06770, partial [Thermoleophilia bacterium]
LGALLLAAFILVERRQEHPTLRLSMFRNVTFTAANIANVLEGVAMITALVQVPFFAYVTRDATPIEGGLLVIRMTVMIPIGALAGGLLVNRISHRVTAVAGFALAAIGLYMVSCWPVDTDTATYTHDFVLGFPVSASYHLSMPYSYIQTLSLLIAGFGFGFNSPALAAAVVGSISKARLAAGSAIHVVAKMTGEMVGLAALSGWGIYQFEESLNLEGMSVFQRQQTFSEMMERMRQIVEQRSMDAIMVVLHRFFIIAAIMCAIAIIPCLFIRVKESEELTKLEEEAKLKR